MKKETKEKIIIWSACAGIISCIIVALTYLGISPSSCTRQDKDNNTEAIADKLKEKTNNIEVIESESKTKSVLDRNNCSLNGHEYVDLGLSVNWATCNVGAIHPEDSGQKYAWGEISPKPYYNWENYDFFKFKHGQTFYFSKYYDEYEMKETLEPSDDVATDSWGAGWRIPTKTEFLELINNCTWSWVSQKGAKGYKLTSKKNGFTDKSVFSPVENDSSTTTYWSNLVKRIDDKMAWGIRFEATPVTPYARTEYRFEGHPVRPVCKVK